MKDINFFDSYIVKRKLSINKQIIYYFFIISLIIAIGLYAIFNQIKINILTKEISELQKVVEDDQVIEKIDEISDKRHEIEHLGEHLKYIESYNDLIDDNSKINDALFEMLTASIPDGVFLTSISAYTDEINIVGKSQEQLFIAQLIKNIESFQIFKEVFVSSITKEDKFYSFILDISLKDVKADGENVTIIEETNY